MNRRIKWSLAGALGAATAASACCTVPLVLASAGIGGAWVSNLVALEAFRPFFIGLTVLLLGTAMFQAIKRPVGTDCECKVDADQLSKNVNRAVVPPRFEVGK